MKCNVCRIHDVSIKDFPYNTKITNSNLTELRDNEGHSGGLGFDTTYQTFHDQVIGKEEGFYYIIIRTMADERERVARLPQKWDELDNNYTVVRIDKLELFELWTGEVQTKELQAKSDSPGGGGAPTNTGGSYRVMKHFRDNYGSGRGYPAGPPYFTTNSYEPMYTIDRIRIKLTAPHKLTPEVALDEFNTNWVKKDFGWWAGHEDFKVDDTGERVGLNPKYDIDFLGYPDIFYNNVILKNAGNHHFRKIDVDGGEISYERYVLETTQTTDVVNYFSSSLITQNDFRPISFISSSFDIDCQNYYNDEDDNEFIIDNKISAPGIFRLGFKLSEYQGGNERSDPNYFDPLDSPFNYHFFVVNWDWNDDDPGGGDCENSTDPNECLHQIANNFPESIDELDILNREDDLYLLKTIGDSTDDDHDLNYYEEFTPRLDLATHQYLEPGFRIIKAVVFSTVDMNPSGIYDISDDNDYVQAVTWKLVTIRINVTEDRTVVADFFDVGGDDFVYLPYPDIVDLDIFDQNGNEILSEDTEQPYKSSHVVISGLSEDSIYANNLKKILKLNNFGRNEIIEKIEAKKSRANSPGGNINEYGDFLGKSDISHVRYFNTGSYDMKTLLGITVVETNGGSYNPHSSDYWSCSDWNGIRNYCFEKSPIDSIFINEYANFRESCLFELNLSDVDGKSTKDTSGNGNKGILIGDYAINKDKINKKSRRDSYIKIPKIQKKNGAI